ncbi:MAG: nickel pincer cofactor biosynthesis protein LarB [Firmicutes bacterium]|nr:nickel pincer cofactor biosynthesis protein LarB [Bacillota bacterium]
MEQEPLRRLLEAVRAGETSVGDAVERLRHLPFEDIGYAKIDHHRALRQGYPEVVFCPGKRPEQVKEIVRRIMGQGSNVLATRCGPELYSYLKDELPEAHYHEAARILEVRQVPVQPRGRLLVVSAGTADLPVAEEAIRTAEAMGCRVKTLFDSGVAGIHRLFDAKSLLFSAQVIIVVAGMEGALASVVGGLVDKPVIAVPTSVGYGASFNGIAALLAMLNSCAMGVSVVNIDNGFGAAAAAAAIIRQISQSQADEEWR